MPQDASQASLPDVFRSLNVAPDYKEALVQLAEKVSQLEHEREHQQMLSAATAPPPPSPPPPGRPRHKRDHPHLRLVTVFAVMAAGAAEALRAAFAWTAARGVRKAVALAAGTAIAGGAVLAPHMATPGGPADPDIIRVQPLPSDHDSGSGPAHHRYHHALVRTWPPVMVRRRRKTAHEHAADHDVILPPAPSPSPSASPTDPPTDPPTPTPQVSISPGPAGQVIARAPLGAFPGLAWDDIPAWRSVP